MDGSALVCQGHTRVLAFVVGPREPSRLQRNAATAQSDRALLSVDLSSAPFSFSERKAVSRSDRRTTELCVLLRQTFESVVLTQLYPGSVLSLHVQVLQNDGGVLAAAVNALTLALCNAGVPMKDMLCACSVGLADNTPMIGKNNRRGVQYASMLLSLTLSLSLAPCLCCFAADLNFSERSSETPELLVASLVHSRRVALLQAENKTPLSSLAPMLELALEGNEKIHQILKQHTKEYSEAILRSRGMLHA